MAALHWTSHPVRRQPDRLALLTAVVLLSAWAVMVTLDSAYLAALAAVILLVSTAAFWMPTRYRIDGDGVEERRWPRRRFRAWSQVRRLGVGDGAALVSPFAQPHRLDRLRGLVVYFDGGPREEIVAALRAGIAAAAEAQAGGKGDGDAVGDGD